MAGDAAGALTPTQADDRDLYAAARNGDAAAFAEVYRRFAPVVHGIALARVGPSDADDVTQEVFLRLHRRVASLQDARALPGWICTVARRAATDHLRARRPAPRPPTEEPEAPTPARETDLRRLRLHVLGCIDRLPEAYREPLVLRLVEGLTGPEIAVHTGMTPGSVRVNLCRGMALLRPLLEGELSR